MMNWEQRELNDHDYLKRIWKEPSLLGSPFSDGPRILGPSINGHLATNRRPMTIDFLIFPRKNPFGGPFFFPVKSERPSPFREEGLSLKVEKTERERFELSMHLSMHTRLPSVLIQPL
jgi:hypothetical protein